jgi:DNA (cytosine-5)-methyltransferase 3A
MNVLSLFDGMSCGQIALNRAGITYNNYYASEIDKHAIKVTQANYPNTIQLGDITQWHTWKLPKIDLIIGGFPCQPFSASGKQLAFDDPRGKLFFALIDILRYYKPTYFLFENVKMKEDSEQIITGLIGIKPILIDSALVSAQSRKRLYWTNIPNITQPDDKGIMLRDILEETVDSKYLLRNSYTLRDSSGRLRLEVLRTNYRNVKQSFVKPVLVSEVVNDTPSGRSRQTDRLYSALSKSPTLLANRSIDLKIDVCQKDLNSWRTLTPVECERLQTVPENYTSSVADRHRYRAIGNGWTVDVIAHIFKGLTHEGTNANKPTTITG